jgi:hypothetical protein
MTGPMNASRPSTDPTVLSNLDRAVACGVAWLAGSQRADGEFDVYASLAPDLTHGCNLDPSIFPTAVMAQALGHVPEADGLRGRALDFLVSERDRFGLWRHWARRNPLSASLPPDLDDTACASDALSRGGYFPGTNREILLGNRDRQGRFRTWLVPGTGWTGHDRLTLTASQLRHIPVYVKFFQSTSASLDDVDAVVNANVIHYLGEGDHVRPVVAWLKTIIEEGREAQCDRWYDTPCVVRYFISRALRKLAPDARPLMTTRLAETALSGGESAFETALTACSLLDWDLLPHDLIHTLLADQGDDGTWQRQTLYHGGRARRPGGGFADPVPDTPHWGSNGLTTAFCLEAIARYRAISKAT